MQKGGTNAKSWKKECKDLAPASWIALWLLPLSYCIAQETLLNAMWQARWEGSLGEKGYVYMDAESLFWTPETITTLLIGCTPI